MTRSLKNRTALVTGSAVRVGRAIVLGLAELGCRVIVHYNRSREEAEQTVAEAQAHGVEAIAVSANLSDPAAAATQLFRELSEQGMSPDILINNASVFAAGTLTETDEALWDRQQTVNLKAPFFLCREFARQLGNERQGDIINLCDWRGLKTPPGHDAYTLSKAGLVALTNMLAQELAPMIRVNGIAPGAILPPVDGSIDFEQRAREFIPLKQTGSPDDIVHGVLYLLESDFVTGEMLRISGGEGVN